MTLEAEFAERIPFLRALARRLATDSSIADDLVQETYVAAMTAGPRRAKALVPWLGAVLRNLAARRVRADSRRRRREEASARSHTTPDTIDVAIKLDVSRRLLQHVEALDVPGRDAIFLRYYENLKPQQIAERLGVPLDTVKTRLARALDRLRERLDADHPQCRQNWLPALAAIGGLETGPFGVGAGHSSLARRAPFWRPMRIAAGVLFVAIVAVAPFMPTTEPSLATRATTAHRDVAPDRPTDPRTLREAVAAAGQVVIVRGLVEDAGLGAEPGHGRPAADVVVHCTLALPSEPAVPPGDRPTATLRRTIEVETTSDAQGCIQQELPASAALVAVRAAGNETFREAWWRNPQGSSAAPGVPERIVLTRFPDGQLCGLVTEPSAAPVADARVTLTHWHDGERRVVETTVSAAVGSFLIRPCGTDSWLSAERAGFVQVSVSEPRRQPRGGWEPARILLAPAGTLTIEVVDPTGAPVREEQNVAVSLGGTEQGLLEAMKCSDGQGFRVVVPLERGRAILPVPSGVQLAVFAGSTTFGREQDGRCLPVAADSEAGRPIVVGAGQHLSLRVVLLGLAVRVLDADGNPAVGADLRFQVPRNGRLDPLLLATTDAHGQFALDLGTAGDLRFLLCTATGSGSTAGLRAQQWLRLDAASPPRVELRLESAQQLTGHVRDAGGRAVAARVRYAVALPGEDEPIGIGEWQADARGAFSIPNLAGAAPRLEILSDGFATVVRDDVHPGAPIEVVLEQPKRSRLRLLANAAAPRISDLVVRVDYLAAEDGIAPVWPVLGATTSLSPAVLHPFLPPRDLARSGRGPAATWRTEEHRHVPPIDGPHGRTFELQLDSGPAAISICGRGADGATLSLVATGPVTIPAGDVELPLALSPTTTCRGRIVLAADAKPFAACVGLADDTGRLLMLSRSRGATWETMQVASSHGFFALPEVPIGTWELRVGTRAELERGEARQRRRVVITGDADEAIVVTP